MKIEMDEEDPRIPCQYGSSCYQKNEIHHSKYKHPLNSDRNTNEKRQEEQAPISQDKPVLKKPKISDSSFSGNLKQQKLNSFFKKKETNRKPDDFSRLQNTNRNDSVALENSNKVGETSKKEPTESKTCAKDTEDTNKNDSAALESSNEVGETSKNEPTESKNFAKDIRFASKNYPVNLDEAHELIKKLFLVDMPDDFFGFWKFCQQLNQDNAMSALKSIDFELIGPFDVLAGKLTEDKVTDLSSVLRHWRYYYDPPEFETVLKCNGPDLFHVGYFRDEPDSLPVFVACNSAAKDAVITPIGENIFAALDWCIKKFEKSCSPFQKVKYSSLKTALHNWAKEHNFTLDTSTESIRSRNRNVVAKTLHHAGIVVPYDKKTEVGYRPLAETQSNLIKLLKKLDETKNEEERKAHLSKLHEIVTWANIAMDEGDFGTCLELGLDLFSCGSHHVHRMALQQLTSAYDLLGRHSFSKIIKAHLEDRKKGDNLSVIK